MNKLIAAISLTIVASCGKQEPKSSSAPTEKTEYPVQDTTASKITFHKAGGKAVLLGNDIKLLDGNFKEIKDISNLNGQFADITEVSDKYYKEKPTDTHCQEFRYVKIKTKNFEGYVDGRKLYEAAKDSSNKAFKIDNNEVSFTPTTYFGTGVSDADGLTGCSVNSPVIFRDKAAQYEGLVKIISNKNNESDYPYFELRNDDGALDEILNIEKQDGKYFLTIKRTYQEGEANLLVAVFKDKSGGFVAEILENKRTDE
ncbi:hypothetical protein [Elizabethkingia meningoseptica]|uniref:hypothetical protein n=1 Tax=Elizabethkingia meningoseptica TaxID=238 RepID=UPI003891D97E